MADIINFPVADPDAEDERPVTLEQYLRRGEVHMTVEAATRWLPGFDVRDAAILCLSAGSFEKAKSWWLTHVARLRDELRKRDMTDARNADLQRDYTTLVRAEIAAVRKMRLPPQSWQLERVGAIVAQPTPISEPARREAGDV